ncbi:GFA family protein [Agrobacterium vitis]|uniref:GFA family protein n=1 Tax=Rhizobium/Agrobacterium group TaxID=227290 RepID=UPI001F172890|nr:GFA family protein [Allorhizobium ampelinum]MCF1485518.1 GFA family protein [Allorhizobium ampelinum]
MKQVAKCSCGKLSAVATGEPRKVSACHCKSCQRRTGSPFGVAVFFERSEVVIAGESRTYVRSGDSGMNLTFHFCSDCGSSVYWLPEFRPGLVAVALGCFEDAERFELDQSVYNESAHPWVSLRTK